MANIGPAAKIAIPTIAELLENKYAGVRADAANALWHFGPAAKIAIPAIAELLKDEYAWVRGAAADALSHFGPDAKSTIPAITELLKDQLQKQPGHWSAFWIMGDGVNKVGSGGRDGTEIDIYEKPWLDDRVQQTLHWDGYGKDHKTVGNVAKVSGVMEGWHTFGLWWKPDEYIFYVDGKETWRTKASGVCQVPEYIKLSDEIGDWAGDIKKATLPDAFLVDYVRVYDVVEKQPTTEAAKAQIERLDLGVQMYELDIGTYPTTQQGLQSLRTPPPDLHEPDKWEGPYLVKDVPLDPWGKPYHYRCPGVHNPDTFDVWSVGPDGKEIGNWTPNVVEKK